MKKLFASLAFFITLNNLAAQNVGIGTNAPTKLLSVKGMVVVGTIYLTTIAKN